MQTNDIFSDEFRERYKKDGFTEEEIDQIQKDTLYFREHYAKKEEPREILSQAYINSQKRISKKVINFLGLKMY